MKIKNFAFFLLTATCLLPKISFAEIEIMTNRSGLVVIAGQSKQLNLQTSQSPLQTREGIYMHGTQQGPEKQKVYVLAFLSNDMRQEKYWTFERPLTTLFEYKKEVYALDADGQVHHQQGDSWPKASWHFPRYSEIISTEKTLVVCYSRSPLSNGPERGGCTAPDKNWMIAIDWLWTSPQMCDGKLRVRRYSERPPFVVVQYNPDTGAKEWEKTLGLYDDDICTIPLR